MFVFFCSLKASLYCEVQVNVMSFYKHGLTIRKKSPAMKHFTKRIIKRTFLNNKLNLKSKLTSLSPIITHNDNAF